MATKKPARVTRQWLLNLADRIHNSKNRTFLLLCSGTLQNGPHPKTGKPMHCGLGELYFEMTGHQPEEDRVSERDVIDACVENSPLAGGLERAIETARKAIKAQKLPKVLEENLLIELDDASGGGCDEDDESGITEFMPEAEKAFREALGEIPGKNDEETGYCKVGRDDDEEEYDSYEQYRNRASRVATLLRKAARCLPA